jgi:hypothetical protein
VETKPAAATAPVETARVPEAKPADGQAEPTVVAAMPAGAPAASEESPFYMRWLGFAEEQAKPTATVAIPAAIPGTPVQASMGSSPKASSDQPFYARWLGFGSDEPAQAAPEPTMVGLPAAAGPVPVPPSRPKTAHKKLPGEVAKFTSLD